MTGFIDLNNDKTVGKSKLDNLTHWKPGQSGNPKGRPRTLVSSVLKSLKEEGVEAVKKAEVVTAIEMLLNCTENEIMKFSRDRKQSALIRIVATQIIKSVGKDGTRIFEMLLDRAFGKADQKVESTINLGTVYPDTIESEEAKEVKKEETKRP